MSGLLPKLTLFFLLLALPTLVLVDAVVLSLELRELDGRIERGAIERTAHSRLAVIAAIPRNDPQFAARAEIQLHRLIAALQDPKGELSEAAADVLFELDPMPVRAALVDANGERMISVPDDWLPQSRSTMWRYRHLAKLPVADSDYTVWVGVDLQAPWWRALAKWRIEWPILLLIGAMFGLSGAWFLARYVTRRIARISAAAQRWRGGDFAQMVGDPSHDELGAMSRQLDEMAAQLKALLHERGERRVLEERARLARDLHDVVKQKAFALSLKLGAAEALTDSDATPARKQLADARRLIGEIQRDLVETIEDLRVPQRSGPLHQSVHDRANAVLGHSEIALGLALDPVGEIANEDAEHLLQILSEALTNVLRHANASAVEVRLEGIGDRLNLKIHDNGGGLRHARQGQGMRSMYERAAQLPEGELLISNEDGGTTVTLSLRR